jgi:hypothetical protein
MNQFRFEGGLRTSLLILMAIGALSLVITYIGDSGELHHARFWSNVLHNSVFFTGIACLALFFLCVCITAWSGWTTLFKRVWEAYAMFLVPGLVLMLIIGFGAWFGWHHMYEWSDSSLVAEDKVLKGKSSFLNPRWYVFGTTIIVGVWILIANRIRKLSLSEDQSGDTSFVHHHRMRVWAAAGLPVCSCSCARRSFAHTVSSSSERCARHSSSDEGRSSPHAQQINAQTESAVGASLFFASERITAGEYATQA